MSHFPTAVAEVLRWEGGYVNHPDDPGGATNYGISLRWYQASVDPDAVVEDIKSLSKDEAVKLYKDKFWRDKYELIHSRPVAIKFFDQVVNMGERQATLNLQRAVKACGVDVEEDGKFGPLTAQAANKCLTGELVAAMRATQAGYYRLLAATKPQFDSFLNGWLRRAYA